MLNHDIRHCYFLVKGVYGLFIYCSTDEIGILKMSNIKPN